MMGELVHKIPKYKRPPKIKDYYYFIIPTAIVRQEKADGLATKGCLVNQAPYNLVIYVILVNDQSNTYKTMLMSILEERTKEKQWRNYTLNVADCPRSIAVAAFHFTSEQDCLCCSLPISDSG
ncbi:hypothetical protein NPIL_186321 [Nephila pilipes]|uniref:Uncharacterized protein n=1 Tax=Nephila pilipes TaxID=299642 RepID=A0A8X6MNH7_NEPPI|nr:hypothetical protein NPIL_186321 [Nephila pilipes]